MVELIGQLTEAEYKSLVVAVGMKPEPIDGKPGWYLIKINARMYAVATTIDTFPRNFIVKDPQKFGPLSAEERRELYQESSELIPA